MKKLPILFSGLLAAGHLFAQSPAQASDCDPDRSALREIGSRYEQAINSGDLRPLAQYVAPTASAVFATNDEVQGLDQIQQFFESIKKRLGSNSSYTVHLDPDTTQFYNDIALCHGRSDETATLGNGKTFHFLTHWTAVLQKQGGTWKALRLQVTMDPFENAAVEARLLWRAIVVSTAGGIASLLAFVVGRASKRSA